MKRSSIALSLLIATSAFGAFRHQREVIPATKGANRLEVDAALLAGAQQGLGDLRLVDRNGREVPYLLLAPPRTEPQWDAVNELLPVASTKTTSGFEADLGRAKQIDRVRLEDIPAPFLKRVRVEGSGDRARWTLLADATVFDLPDEKLRNVDAVFTAGNYRYVRCTWDDRSSARVTATPRVSVRLHGSGASPEPLRVPVPFQTRTSEPRKSRYRVTLPGMRLPLDAIELDVAQGDVFRRGTISEPQLQGAQVVPVQLGSSEIRRTERDGAVAADLDIPVAPPSGRDLELVVDDGSNPPLAIRGVIARFDPQVSIYFESADGTPLTARYGDAKLAAPRYDLEASRKYAESSAPPAAKWGPSSKPPEKAAPSAFVMPPYGATVDRGKFAYARPVPRANGLVVLVLDADVLALSSALDDARIVDKNDRQVPYLVERRDEPLGIDLAIPQRQVSDGRSLYRFRLPYERMPNDTMLVLKTNARVFTRSVELRHAENEDRGRGSRTITATTWSSSDPDAVPSPLSFIMPFGRDIELLVDEGDNAPLELAAAQLLLPSAALRFAHPGNDLTLLYGAPNLGAPRYDIALLAPRLFAEPAKEIALAKSNGARPAEKASRERTWFWVAIGAAALVLLAMLGRLLAPVRGEETRPLGETPGGGDAPR